MERVFAIFELAEAILLALPKSDILLAAAATPRLRAVFENSPAIRHRLEDDTTTVGHFEPPGFVRYLILDKTDHGDSTSLRDTDTYHRMLIIRRYINAEVMAVVTCSDSGEWGLELVDGKKTVVTFAPPGADGEGGWEIAVESFENGESRHRRVVYEENGPMERYLRKFHQQEAVVRMEIEWGEGDQRDVFRGRGWFQLVGLKGGRYLRIPLILER